MIKNRINRPDTSVPNLPSVCPTETDESTQKNGKNPPSSCSDPSTLRKGPKPSGCLDQRTQKKGKKLPGSSYKSVWGKGPRFSGCSDQSTLKKDKKASGYPDQSTLKKIPKISGSLDQSTLKRKQNLYGFSNQSILKKPQKLSDCSNSITNVKTDMTSTHMEGASNQAPSLDISADLNCAICLDGYSWSRMKHLPCSHGFHQTCIDQWLKIRKVCPLCLKRPTPLSVLTRSTSNQLPKTFRPLSNNHPPKTLQRPSAIKPSTSFRLPAYNEQPENIRRTTNVPSPGNILYPSNIPTPYSTQSPSINQPPDDNGRRSNNQQLISSYCKLCLAAGIMGVVCSAIFVYHVARNVFLRDS